MKLFSLFIGNAFFFSKNRFSLVGSVQSKPMATFYLLIEKNLTGDLSRIDVYLDNHPGCCEDWANYWSRSDCSYYGCRSNYHDFHLFKSSVKVEIKNQLLQDWSWNTINLTTPQECSSSSGKSYVYLPVKVYSTNITSESFLMSLEVRVRGAITSNVWYASTSGQISISNGKILPCIHMHSRVNFKKNVSFHLNVYVHVLTM